MDGADQSNRCGAKSSPSAGPRRGCPERFGGVGMDRCEAACVLAEEAGRSLAPIPLIQTLVTTEALLALGTGRPAGAVAAGHRRRLGRRRHRLGGGVGGVSGRGPRRGTTAGLISGYQVARRRRRRGAVCRGTERGTGPDGCRPLSRRSRRPRRDGRAGRHARSRPAARDDHARPPRPAEPLGTPAGYHDWLDRAAVILAFEAMGTASAAMAMAVAYAKERVAFGQTIGRYQGVKHKCADMFIKLELARAHALDAVGNYRSRRPRPAPGSERGARRQPRRAGLLPPRRTSRSTAASASPGPATASSTTVATGRWSATLGSRNFWAERLVRSLEQRNAAAA